MRPGYLLSDKIYIPQERWGNSIPGQYDAFIAGYELAKREQDEQANDEMWPRS